MVCLSFRDRFDILSEKRPSGVVELRYAMSYGKSLVMEVITMAMLRFTKTSWVFGIVIILLCCPLSSALVITYSVGRWPPDWPAELSPYRAQARTFDIAWPGNQETTHEIRFKNREEFEKIWPTILTVKSKGGTLKLTSIEKPHDEKSSRFSNSEPVVRIRGPVYPAWPLTFPGGKTLVPGPPWPESAMWATGELPEYVTLSEDHTTWVSYLAEDHTTWVPYLADPNRPASWWRARIDIELVVDGKIIDLNRIRLPADTPIIDKRKPAHKQEASHDHTAWISECLKHVQSIRPGATRGELLEVLRTEGGESTRFWRTYVYKECPYIKVDVEFKAAGEGTLENERDEIMKVSKPFLEWSILD